MFGRLFIIAIVSICDDLLFTVKTSLPSVTLQHRRFSFVMVAVFDVSSQSTLQSSISDTARIGTCVRPFSSTNGCASGNTTSVLSTFYRNSIACFNCKLFQFCSRCTCFARLNRSSRLFGWHCCW